MTIIKVSSHTVWYLPRTDERTSCGSYMRDQENDDIEKSIIFQEYQYFCIKKDVSSLCQ